MMEKDIKAETINAKRKGVTVSFESKMQQAATMILAVHAHYKHRVVVATGSWFGNDGLWSRLDRGKDGCIDLLSRLRTNIVLYDFPSAEDKNEKRRGPRRKYGHRLGCVMELAYKNWKNAKKYSVLLYGKKREVQRLSRKM